MLRPWYPWNGAPFWPRDTIEWTLVAVQAAFTVAGIVALVLDRHSWWGVVLMAGATLTVAVSGYLNRRKRLRDVG